MTLMSATDERAGFANLVHLAVAGLRTGEITTYGQIAAQVGRPGAARAVGQLLARSTGLPWWRVVTADGRLVPGKEDEHARHLVSEGFSVESNRVTVESVRN